MNTTPAKKHSRCRNRGLFASPAKRKALRRRGLTAFRCWQHLTRCFSAFHHRKLAAFSIFRTLRRAFGAAVLALLLPAIAKADNFIVTTNSDTTDGGDGELTLREAITLANNSAGPDTVGFAGGLSGEVLILTQGEFVISEDLNIDASNLAEAPIIDADQNSRIIDFTSEEGSLELTKLTLRNGKVTESKAKGGGIRASGGDITITNSILSGNSASDSGDYGRAFGGGIYASSGDITLVDSTLSGNSASAAGAYSATLGGGISTNSGAITLTNSTLSENSASGRRPIGGGIQTYSGAVTLIASKLSGNSSTGLYGYGGGIWTNSGDVTLTDSTVSENFTNSTRTSRGGGILSHRGDIRLIHSTLSENFTHSVDHAQGGGIYVSSGDVTLVDSTLNGNASNGDFAIGGGINAPSNAAVTITNSTISGNSATGETAYGGGIATRYANSLTLTITNSTLNGNSAVGPNAYGGGIATPSADSLTLTITNSIIAGNLDNGTSPDVQAPNDPANELEVSHCLIGNSTGARLDEAKVNLNNLSDTDPLLAPLADNGGGTQTLLPFPDSPAINAGGGSPPLQDQRGFDRIGLPDIGAVEYQGQSDLVRVFETDTDVDGNSYAIEQALGTDPYAADPSNPRNLTVPTFNPSGYPMLSFGIAEDAAPGTLWILERAASLDEFEEIFRFDGSTQTIGEGATLDVQSTATGVIITDEDPPSRGAFYRFKTILADSG